MLSSYLLVLVTALSAGTDALAIPDLKKLFARQAPSVEYVTYAPAQNIVYKTVYVTMGADSPAATATSGTGRFPFNFNWHGFNTYISSSATSAPTSTPDYTPAQQTSTPVETSPSPTSSAAAAATSSASSATGWQQGVVDMHNQYRSSHSAPALVWDDTLASYAQSHASGCVFQHTGGPYGENLAAGYSDGSAGVTAWYNEVSQYNFASGGFGENTGHFTQVVWVASQKVGCAFVSCDGQNGTPGGYLMCEYDPPGNVQGQYQQNVLAS